MKYHHHILRSLSAALLALVLAIMPLEGILPLTWRTQTAKAIGGYDAVDVLGWNNFTNAAGYWVSVAGSTNASPNASAYDSTNGVVYFAMGSDIWRCEVATGCDDSGDWDDTTPYSPDGDSIVALAIDAGNGVLYAGTQNPTASNVLRCSLGSSCDTAGDWSSAYTSGSNASLNVIGAAGGYLYVVANSTASNEHYVLQCDLSTSCNAPLDYDVNFTLTGSGGGHPTSIVYDSPNSDVYVGFRDGYGGGIYRCDFSTNCDEETDWSSFIGPSGNMVYDIVIDELNDVLYAATPVSGEGNDILPVIIRCVLSTGCDNNSEYTEMRMGETTTIAWSPLDNALYATFDSGPMYRCETATGCDNAADWRRASSTAGGNTVVVDDDNGSVYSGQFDAVYRCDVSTACRDSSDFSTPEGITTDSTNNRTFVADGNYHRVLIFNTATVTDGETPSNVLGQETGVDYDANQNVSPAEGMLSGPQDVAYDAVNDLLYVADTTNNRVLVFDVASVTDGEDAVRVLGQANFSDVQANRGGAVAANTLSYPQSVSINPTGTTLYVSDTGNNRVLSYSVSGGLAGITNGESATGVYGQGGSFITANAAAGTDGLSTPAGVFAEDISDHVWVADSGNNRVLGFTPGNDTAVVVYGQPNFSSNACSAVASDTLCGPEDVTYFELDGADQRLVVADTGNQRVVLYDTSGALTNGDAAVDVFGQLDFDSNSSGTTSTTFNAPVGTDYDEDNARVWISDANNNRVLMFGPPPPAGPPAPGEGEITGVCSGWPSPHVEITWSETAPGSVVQNSNSVIRAVDFGSGEWFFGGPDMIDGTHIDNTPADAGSEPFDYDLRDDSVLIGHSYTYHAKYRAETPTVNEYTVTINAESCGGTPNPNPGGHLGTNSDFLTNSAPSQPSDHTIRFVSGGYIPNGSYFVYTFDPAFDMSAITIGDLSFYYNTEAPFTIAADCSGADAVAGEIIGNTIVMTLCPGDGAEFSQYALVVLYVGGDNQIINPSSTGTFGVRITAYDGDDNVLADDDPFVAIVNPVDLNAVVDATFTFIIDGESGSGTIDSYTVASASSALYVGFGDLTAGTAVTMGSSLSVSTNAVSGFVVTIQQNHNMLASSGADIDSFKDGAVQYPAATWTAPVGTIGSENTYGHMGVATEDSATISATASVTTGSDGEFIGLVAGTPRTIWSYGGPADGTTQDIGHIDVGYRVQVTSLQEAGRYQNRLMYIATPTF